MAGNNIRTLWFSWFTFRYFVHGEGGGSGVTVAKIRKHEQAILADNVLWDDVIKRHSLYQFWPWDAMSEDLANYQHAMGNFWGMIYPLLMTGKQVE